jgi:hypothetical protein
VRSVAPTPAKLEGEPWDGDCALSQETLGRFGPATGRITRQARSDSRRYRGPTNALLKLAFTGLSAQAPLGAESEEAFRVAVRDLLLVRCTNRKLI